VDIRLQRVWPASLTSDWRCRVHQQLWLVIIGVCLTIAHQLQAIMPATAPTYVPQQRTGGYRPGGASRLPGLSAACAG
jgi:hypothetical protein